MHSPQTNTDNWSDVRAHAEQALTPDIVEYIHASRQRPHADSYLISVLHRVQKHFGYLSPPALDAVAQLMQIPAAQVTGVATFYHFFRLEPRGKFIINVCLGTACYVKGASEVVNKIREELGIDFGETSRDNLFTLEASRCLGTCGLAPVVMINDDVHAKVTPDQVPLLLQQYINQAESTP